LRPINLTVFAIWSALSGYALLLHFHSPDWLMWAVMLTSAYLFVIGGIMQLFPGLGRR
jgi:phosphatidylcholine synthase